MVIGSFAVGGFAGDGLLDPSARSDELLSGGVEVGYGKVGGGMWELDEKGDSSAKARIFGIDVGGLAED